MDLAELCWMWQKDVRSIGTGMIPTSTRPSSSVPRVVILRGLTGALLCCQVWSLLTGQIGLTLEAHCLVIRITSEKLLSSVLLLLGSGLLLDIVDGELRAPHMALTMGLPWGALLKQLSQVKLRCATVSLGHLSGRRSAARLLQCIGCDRWVSNTCVHAFGDCPCWDAIRARATVSLQLPVGCRTWDVTYSVLGCAPGSPAFACCLEFMEEVVRFAEAYKYKS